MYFNELDLKKRMFESNIDENWKLQVKLPVHQ